MLDIRNDFEIDIGKFQRSEKPSTTSFREIPKALNNLDINKNEKIAMYCTGGIRCEKASAYLKLNGYKKVIQLEGGIINYLEYLKNKGEVSLWDGECFVFDDRVTVNKNLNQGSYVQCYGCRRPITQKDMQSSYYKKGVSCPYCFNKRTEKQKRSSLTRQKQIDSFEKKRESHPFKRIRSL